MITHLMKQHNNTNIKQYNNILFNQSLNYLILNFKIWKNTNKNVGNRLVEIINIWIFSK